MPDEAFAGFDPFDDPCYAARELKRALYRLTAGQAEASVQYQSLGVMRSVTWSRGSGDNLKALLRQAEDECALSQGLPPPNRRYAIQFGAPRRHRWK